MEQSEMFKQLRDKILVLRQTAWYDRNLKWPEVKKWLEQLTSNDDKLQALFLLSNFMYFGQKEIREMLKSVYRDLYKYPIIADIRKKNGNTQDHVLIESEFKKDLSNTRFLGVGNPSESGTHLLYLFRQENGLKKNLFIHGHETYSREPKTNQMTIKDKSIERYVFIDDFCGSGQQAIDYSNGLVGTIKELNPEATICYYVLFSTSYGLEVLKSNSKFTEVDCVFELDDSYKCFSEDSRYYAGTEQPIDIHKSEKACKTYGERIYPIHPLGYKDSQLLLGFYHNTPDNTLPIIWYEGTYGTDDTLWHPIFHRYDKVY